MDPIYHTIRQILHGTRPIRSETKFVVICFGVALVHLHFTVAFAICGYAMLCVYNLAVTLFYLYHCFVSLKRRRYVFIYVSSMVEILLHSAMVSVLLGWNWGFMLYTIALVPVAFYLSYTLIDQIRNVVAPVLTSVLVMVCYIVVLVVCRHTEPLLGTVQAQRARSYFYYFNTMVMFVMLFLFSILFALEIRYMQKCLEQENFELETLARFDPLTQLLNRRSMNEQMHQAVARAKNSGEGFCLIMADIDDFKKINDTYGHDCGDEVLIRVANVISGQVREHDAVCRWGGEEILLMLRAEKEAACSVAERIRAEIAGRNMRYKKQTFRVTLTMGIAEYREGMDIRELIEQADANLYKGKNDGKNCVVV